MDYFVFSTINKNFKNAQTLILYSLIGEIYLESFQNFSQKFPLPLSLFMRTPRLCNFTLRRIFAAYAAGASAAFQH